MIEGFRYSFPAIRGIQAQKEYYIAMCPLSTIPKLFLFDNELLPAEFRAQRLLNRARIPEITQYILENPATYVFSSLTASIDGDFVFEPVRGQPSLGYLHISMDANFVINDGQHRRAAIEEALKQNPSLGNETISVVFFADQGLRRCQQMFADLNRHAVNTTRSIGILYDSRDELAMITRELIASIQLLRDFTEMESSSLSKYSPKLFTLSSVYNTNSKLIGYRKGSSIKREQADCIKDFWTYLCENMEDWRLVQAKKKKASEVRMESLHSFAVVLSAIAIVANRLLKKNGCFRTLLCEQIGKLNWSRTNVEDWGDCVLDATGRVKGNALSAKQTARKISSLLNLELF